MYVWYMQFAEFAAVHTKRVRTPATTVFYELSIVREEYY